MDGSREAEAPQAVAGGPQDGRPYWASDTGVLPFFRKRARAHREPSALSRGEKGAVVIESRTPRNAVVVTESAARPYGQHITAGGHQLVADEPAEAGGADSGPTPYELLLASLGSCTAITVRMYAERKGWPLRHVTVRLRHQRIHAADCADCETRATQVDHIERELHFDGELTPGQRARLLNIAEHCPVHRMLQAEIHISTTEGASPAAAAASDTDLRPL